MNRRRTLALCGTALASIAGCLSGTSPRPGDENESPSATTGSPTDDGPTVADVVVRKAVRYQSSMGSGGVLAGDDRQYVVASVRSGSNGDLSASQFALETADGSWEPGLPDTVGAVNRSVAGRGVAPVGRPIGAAGTPSYLAFTVPSPLSASEPRITFSGADAREWPLADAARDELGAPAPRFDLASLTVPDAVSQGERLSVELTVRNVSGTDGRFLAAVYWPTALVEDDDESHLVERTVAAGDEVAASLDVDTRYTTAGDESVTLSVDGHVTADREVAVEDASTPS